MYTYLASRYKDFFPLYMTYNSRYSHYCRVGERPGKNPKHYGSLYRYNFAESNVQELFYIHMPVGVVAAPVTRAKPGALVRTVPEVLVHRYWLYLKKRYGTVFSAACPYNSMFLDKLSLWWRKFDGKGWDDEEVVRNIKRHSHAVNHIFQQMLGLLRESDMVTYPFLARILER